LSQLNRVNGVLQKWL